MLTKILLTPALLLALLAFGNLPADSAEGRWEKIAENKTVTVYRMEVKDSPLYAYRFETILKFPVAKVLSVVKDQGRKKDWVEYLVHSENVKSFSEDKYLVYSRFHPPWPVNNKEVLYKSETVIDKEERTATILIQSTELKSKPKKDGYDRMEIHHSKIKLKEHEDPSKTIMEAELHADPKGWIPKWFINMAQRAWPKQTIKRLTRQLKRKDVSTHPKYANLFGEKAVAKK